MSAAFVTGLPAADRRVPYWAPALGALSVPYMDPREVSGLDPQLGQLPDSPEQDIREPIPELVLGVAVAGAGGALTGGVAAGSWRGAGIGAGLNVGLWSALTLVGAWRYTQSTGRALLAVSAILGGAVATGLALTR